MHHLPCGGLSAHQRRSCSLNNLPEQPESLETPDLALTFVEPTANHCHLGLRHLQQESWAIGSTGECNSLQLQLRPDNTDSRRQQNAGPCSTLPAVLQFNPVISEITLQSQLIPYISGISVASRISSALLSHEWIRWRNLIPSPILTLVTLFTHLAGLMSETSKYNLAKMSMATDLGYKWGCLLSLMVIYSTSNFEIA